MDRINSIGKQTFSFYSDNLKCNKDEIGHEKFQSVLNRMLKEKINDRFSNYTKTNAIPAALINKLKSVSDSLFEDVTYDKEYEHMFECGEYKLYRAYYDNIDGGDEKIFFLIRLTPCSRDAKIDSDKLQVIFEKANAIAKAVMPIYAKMNNTAILAGMDFQLPFREATGEVDFDTFIKRLMEHLNSEINNLPAENDMKEELQKMLKECEDTLFKAIDDEKEEAKMIESTKETLSQIELNI